MKTYNNNNDNYTTSEYGLTWDISPSPVKLNPEDIYLRIFKITICSNKIIIEANQTAIKLKDEYVQFVSEEVYNKPPCVYLKNEYFHNSSDPNKCIIVIPKQSGILEKYVELFLYMKKPSFYKGSYAPAIYFLGKNYKIITNNTILILETTESNNGHKVPYDIQNSC